MAALSKRKAEKLAWQMQKEQPNVVAYLLAGEYRKILFDERVRSDYSQQIIATVNRLARKQGLDGKMRLCF